MSPQELQNQIELTNKRVDVLERIAIQLKLDPQTKLYLDKAINNTVPAQIYSTSSPSGVALSGSLWMEDTGVLATRKIHVYSGSGWVQMK